MNPANSSGEVLLFWDYDTQWGGDRSRAPGGPKGWGALEFGNTERLLEILAVRNLPACFAVVGRAATPGARPYHDPSQIRRIHAMGHEVASHSFEHEWLPGLPRRRLLEALASSRDALEQCIGAPVVTFVPPYNQPFDYPAGFSISLSERREAKGERTGLLALCRALAETGYRFCRVAYRPIPQRLAEKLAGRRRDHPSRVETIAGISCVRLNTPCGFDAPSVAMLDRCAWEGGIAVVYGHPHSLDAENSQHERHLIPFLDRITRAREAERLRVRLPREISGEAAA